MGVYIPGIKIPKDEPGAFQVIVMYVGADGKLRAECEGTHEVTIVPPHGRLIDADKQDAQIDALIERHLHGYTKSTWDFVCELRDILKRNSTIIQAEPEEEEMK